MSGSAVRALVGLEGVGGAFMGVEVVVVAAVLPLGWDRRLG